jgi:type VI protein secretion system component VasK
MRNQVRWWRGYELIAVIVVFWFAVIGVWLALIAGSRATGAHVPGNPIVAVADVAFGHTEWPGGYATLLVILEAAFLGVMIWLARRVLIERAKKAQKAQKSQTGQTP